jgi:hypothetical protein
MKAQDVVKGMIEQLYRDSSVKYNFLLPRGAKIEIIAQDGQFLGSASNRFDADSIFNRYGTYGGKYSPMSMFNRYGNYGSRYAQLSPFNRYTQIPPKIFVNGSEKALLTMNKYLQNAIPVDTFLYITSQYNDIDNDRLNEMMLEIVDRLD